MNTSEILVLSGIYLVVGLIFSIRYACSTVQDYMEEGSEPEDEIIGSRLFYGLFGEWCSKHNVDYGYLMLMYSLLLWPTYLLSMTHSVLSVIWRVIYYTSSSFWNNSCNLISGIKHTLIKS